MHAIQFAPSDQNSIVLSALERRYLVKLVVVRERHPERKKRLDNPTLVFFKYTFNTESPPSPGRLRKLMERFAPHVDASQIVKDSAGREKSCWVILDFGRKTHEERTEIRSLLKEATGFVLRIQQEDETAETVEAKYGYAVANSSNSDC